MVLHPLKDGVDNLGSVYFSAIFVKLNLSLSRAPRMSSSMLCNFINQEVRRQLLIKAIFEGD